MEKINIKPLNNNILIKPLGTKDIGLETKSVIFIPETVDKEKPDQGIVVAVGPGKRDEKNPEKRIPVSVKNGQKVIFSKYGPDEIKINDKKYYIINEDNILAIID